jgi:hypothetical protein
VKERSPKRELYVDSHLDRNSEDKTIGTADDSTASNPRKGSRNRRTQDRLSPHARATLQRIGGVNAVYNGAESVAFLTGTFPGSTFAAQSAIASQAGWLVNALKAWIYKRIGANVAYWVWEFQKRGTLHLHYVVVIPDERDRNRLMADFRDEWIRLIKGASARSGVNLFIGEKSRDFFTEKEKLQIYAQQCYKNCSSYLSKYLAKSKPSNFPAPCRLWGCTREARNLVARNLITVEISSKTLSRASEMAYEYDSCSNVSSDKRRYFRHRFSQGFTILLYDDNLRAELITEEPKKVDEKGLQAALDRLSWKIFQFHAGSQLNEMGSLPLRQSFKSGRLNLKSCNGLKQLQQLDDNLAEIGVMVFLIPAVKPWHREEIKNLVEACRCLIQ